MNKLKYSNEVREKLLAGVNAVADAVKVTLGAKGRNVAIRRAPGQIPEITKDGVKVANSILQLEDPYEDMGAQMIKGAARGAMNMAGDGTTTATLLAQKIFTDGIAEIESGHNPMDLKKGIDKAVVAVVAEIKSQSIKIERDHTQLLKIAIISANGDKEIAEAVATVVEQVGESGLVSMVKSKNTETTSEVVEGMQFDRGYTSPYFITNPGKGLAELEKPFVLMYDGKISKLSDIQNILDVMHLNKTSLLIIAEDVDSDAFFTILPNVLNGKLKVAIARAPFGGVEGLEDIATVVGGQVISEKKGHVLKNINLEMLGRAESVKVSVDNTIIAGGKGKKHDIRERIKNIEQQMDETTENDKQRFRSRLVRMSESVAIIYVGAQTDVEVSEKMDRVDDAVRATQAAIKEGIVPGGGIVYLNCIKSLKILQGKNLGEDAGIRIIIRALEEPIRQILKNAGVNADDILSGLSDHQGDYGYNVKTECYEEFFVTGIIDPAKVSRVALEKAASISSILLTTEACVV